MNIKYAPLPESAVFSLGGFTCFKPDEWNRFLRNTIRQYHPFYFLRHLFHKHADPSWKTNDCIFDSLKKYLLCEFGILLPSDTIFKVFNEKGEGVLPGNLMQAISAIIEPLGLEVDRIMVSNPVLRNGLGCPEKTVDIDYATEFDRKPGICMINVNEGTSHAFFWQNMDTSKFISEQFRMALLIRYKQPDCRPTFSALKGLEALRQMFKGYLSKQLLQYKYHRLGKELDAIIDYVYGCEQRNCDEFRSTFDARLGAWLFDMSTCVKVFSKNKDAGQSFLTAGQMVRNIFKQIEIIQ